MEVYAYVVIGALTIAVIALAIKVWQLRAAANEIAAAFADKLATDTNTLIDVSCGDRQMRRLAAEINRQLALLREERHRFYQGDAELKEAVTNISHDLRTPLTAICGYLDLLGREEKTEAVEKYIGMIANRAEALKTLTEELFRYSVIISVNEESAENVILNDALEENLLSFYGAMTKRGIQPEIDISDKKAERRLNRSSLSRVFGNIISNALKYSDGDLAVAMNEHGVITFANTAKSLTSVEVGKLFDRFFTVETGRGSTGLGLSIAKLLTERMGGEISAEYVSDKLIITLHFPARD